MVATRGEKERKKNRQIVFSKVFMERLFTLGLWWYGIPENSFQHITMFLMCIRWERLQKYERN